MSNAGENPEYPYENRLGMTAMHGHNYLSQCKVSLGEDVLHCCFDRNTMRSHNFPNR